MGTKSAKDQGTSTMVEGGGWGKIVICQNFCRRLHENEKKLDREGYASKVNPRSAYNLYELAYFIFLNTV